MDNAIRDLGREIAIRNRRKRARQAIDDEAAQIILNGKRDNLVLSDIAQRLNSAGKKTSSGKDFGKIQVLRAWQMLQAGSDTDNVVENDTNELAVKATNEVTEQQVDIEAEIQRSKLVTELKAENAELKAERDKVNQTLHEFSNSNGELALLTAELQEENDTLKAQLEISQSATKRLREENEELLAEIEPLRKQLADTKSHSVITPNDSALKEKLEVVLKPFQELIANNSNPNQPRLKKMVEIVKAIEGIL